MDVYNWFWSETFWFPEGKTWKLLENDSKSNIYVPQAKDLYWSLPLGLALLLLRYAVEAYILVPFGFWFGVKEKKIKAMPDPMLENLYKKNGFVNKNSIESVAKQTDMTVQQVEVWLRKRRKQSTTPTIRKFTECSWHCIFYIFSVSFGLFALWDKPWFSEMKYCWKDWPSLHVANDVYWYYLVQMSYYWCLIFSIATDHKRKDWKEMTTHHLVTIALLYFSWVMNFVRVGSLVLLVHDTADIPLNATKCAKYAGRPKLCDALLACFIPSWVISRIIIYPFRIVYSSMFEVTAYIEPFTAYYMFIGLLIALQILHIMWTYMIAKIAVLTIKNAKFEDVRSDTEDSAEE